MRRVMIVLLLADVLVLWGSSAVSDAEECRHAKWCDGWTMEPDCNCWVKIDKTDKCLYTTVGATECLEGKHDQWAWEYCNARHCQDIGDMNCDGDKTQPRCCGGMPMGSWKTGGEVTWYVDKDDLCGCG